MSRMFEWVQEWWASERTRHFLWVPACFAAGIGLYYAWGNEPAPYVFPLLLLFAILGVIAFRREGVALWLALALVFGGASWANLRTVNHQPTMLNEALSPRPVMGVVRDIERTERGVRLLLAHVTVDGLPAQKTPEQIRLSVKFKKGTEFELPRIGDAISIRAGLMPAMGPALPNGFDFARYFYFRDIGAIGYGLPPWNILAHDSSDSFANRFWTWRANLTNRIIRALGVETGGIAAGLITGDGRAISEADFEALRASNLYHIIAISGEHMVIIAGVIFVSLRLLLLALPKRFSLRPQGKSIAACFSLILVTIYIFVTGLPISAVRAYVMIVLVLLAVMFRRHVDPMRSLAIAALLILIYDPASLLEPGFQLSFAATMAIIALVESRMLRQPPAIERGRVRRALHFISTLLLVSVVAEAATTPLAISMFNNASFYGVFANALATPLVSLFLMPMVALFFILLPFGAEGLALTLLHYGITALLALAHWVASFPQAQIFLPSLPSWGLGLFAIGLLWACLWRTRARWAGLLLAVLGVASIATVLLPDMLVGGTLKQIALRSETGYALARGRPTSMLPEMWAHGLGYKELPKAQAPAWVCDEGKNCIAAIGATRIAFPKTPSAFAAQCGVADVLFTRTENGACAPTMLIAAEQLSGNSVTALWLEGKDIRRETSANWQGTRPWSVRTLGDDGNEE